MKALALLAVCASAHALPPITQEDALRFHKDGLCQMEQPGTGLHRPDGDGWIVSSLPGPHRIFDLKGGRVIVKNEPVDSIDMTPGYAVILHVEPGAQLQWCPMARVSGRDQCGPVPPAFLYDARKVERR